MASTTQQQLAAVLDAFPSPVFLTDDDVVVLEANTAARRALGLADRAELGSRRRAGELLRCVNALESPEGCGRMPDCKKCAVREAVGLALSHGAVFRAQGSLHLRAKGPALELFYLVSAAPVRLGSALRAIVTLEDVTELEGLRALLPVCTVCHQPRRERTYWKAVERYLREHTGGGAVHAVCDGCARRLTAGDEDEGH
jgi:PAS domain-containing protein